MKSCEYCNELPCSSFNTDKDFQAKNDYIEVGKLENKFNSIISGIVVYENIKLNYWANEIISCNKCNRLFAISIPDHSYRGFIVEVDVENGKYTINRKGCSYIFISIICFITIVLLIIIISLMFLNLISQ